MNDLINETLEEQRLPKVNMLCVVCFDRSGERTLASNRSEAGGALCDRCFETAGIKTRKSKPGARIDYPAEKRRKAQNFNRIEKLMIKTCMNLSDDEMQLRMDAYNQEIDSENKVIAKLETQIVKLERDHSCRIDLLRERIADITAKRGAMGTFSRWFGEEYKELSRQYKKLHDQLISHRPDLDSYSYMGNKVETSEEKNALSKDIDMLRGRIRLGQTRIVHCEMARRMFKKIPNHIHKERKKEQTRAAAAAHYDELRGGATVVKKKLKITEVCPYCEQSLGKDYEADHIYPVAKGGLSTTENMVHVCKSCNRKKSGLTLRKFCEKYGFDESGIASRLSVLGKDY
jgi:hypothetical protein